jgi:N-acetylmuramoyl-L-alanine amidase
VPPPPDLSALSTPRPAIRTIAIDPGHGGEDEGVKSASGTTEKELTLAVARRLKAAAEGRLGVRVLLTRDEDRNVAIDERSAIANNSKVDLFISLHANASMRGSAGGASIQVVNFSEAERARATLKPEPVPVFGGSTRDIEVVQWDLAQIRYVDQSSALALALETAFRGRVPLDQRPVDSAPFRVLESANMPAVLVEMGYLTNEMQARQLAGAEFQNTLVQAIVDGITSFRDHLEQNPEAER